MCGAFTLSRGLILVLVVQIPWICAAQTTAPARHSAKSRITGVKFNSISFRVAGKLIEPHLRPSNDILRLPNGVDVFCGRELYFMTKRDQLVPVNLPKRGDYWQATFDGKYLWAYSGNFEKDLKYHSFVYVIEPARRAVLETFTEEDGLPSKSSGSRFGVIAAIGPGRIVGNFSWREVEGNAERETTLAVLSYEPGRNPRRKLETLHTTNKDRGGDGQDFATKYGPIEIYSVPVPTEQQPAQKLIVRRNGYTTSFPAFLLDISSMKLSIVDDPLPANIDQRYPGSEMILAFDVEKNRVIRIEPPDARFEESPIEIPAPGGRMAFVDGSLLYVQKDATYVADEIGKPFRRIGPGYPAANWIKYSNHYGLVTIGSEDLGENRYASQVVQIDLKRDDHASH
jgi:hypothetical protein